VTRRSSFTQFAISIGRAATDAMKAQRRAEADEIKNATARAKLEILQMQSSALIEREHNRSMIQDLQIEVLTRKVHELSRRLGVESPGVPPPEYTYDKEQKP
jgi:FixJ family two-component response regulator